MPEDDRPDVPLPPTQNPPLLDYPSRPTEPDRSTESWAEVVRAMLIVLGFMAAVFLILFGFCGVLGHGCS